MGEVRPGEVVEATRGRFRRDGDDRYDLLRGNAFVRSGVFEDARKAVPGDRRRGTATSRPILRSAGGERGTRSHHHDAPAVVVVIEGDFLRERRLRVGTSPLARRVRSGRSCVWDVLVLGTCARGRRKRELFPSWSAKHAGLLSSASSSSPSKKSHVAKRLLASFCFFFFCAVSSILWIELQVAFFVFPFRVYF